MSSKQELEFGSGFCPLPNTETATEAPGIAGVTVRAVRKSLVFLETTALIKLSFTKRKWRKNPYRTPVQSSQGEISHSVCLREREG